MSNREKDPTLTKPIKLKTYNWPEIADKFLADLYDEDYITKEHIKDIAVDFRLEYKLNKEFSYLYIDRAVRKRLGWLPCIVCGKASVMQTGESLPKFYCSKHIPPYKIQHQEKVETNAESQDDIEPQLLSFALNFLFTSQDPGKEILRSELISAMNDYIEHFSLKYNDVQKLVDKAIVEFRIKSKTTPEFKPAYELLEREKGKTILSMELKEETATIDECLVTGESKSTSITHDKTYVDPTIDHDKNLIIPGTQEDQKSNLVLEDITHDKKLVPDQTANNDLVMKDFDQWYTSLEKTTLDKKALQSKICEKFRELAELAKETIKVKTRQEGEFSIPNIQGLIRRYQKCYKGNCQCMKGKPHGPYYYLRIYLNGKEIQIYLGRAV